MQDGPTSLIETLPPELLADIASHLEPAELTNLRLVSRTFAALSDEAFDIAWQPHLETLKQIDPTISLSPPENAIPGWRQAQFKQHFMSIAQQQVEKIDYFRARSEGARTMFAHITGLAKTLGETLERERLLNQFNATQRKPTALPDALDNFTALTTFNCSEKQLTALPDAFGNCTALKELDCSARLGQRWYEKTMASQKSPPVLCLDQEFNRVLFSSGIQNNNLVVNERTCAPANSTVNKTFKL